MQNENVNPNPNQLALSNQDKQSSSQSLLSEESMKTLTTPQAYMQEDSLEITIGDILKTVPVLIISLIIKTRFTIHRESHDNSHIKFIHFNSNLIQVYKKTSDLHTQSLITTVENEIDKLQRPDCIYRTLQILSEIYEGKSNIALIQKYTDFFITMIQAFHPYINEKSALAHQIQNESALERINEIVETNRDVTIDDLYQIFMTYTPKLTGFFGKSTIYVPSNNIASKTSTEIIDKKAMIEVNNDLCAYLTIYHQEFGKNTEELRNVANTLSAANTFGQDQIATLSTLQETLTEMKKEESLTGEHKKLLQKIAIKIATVTTGLTNRDNSLEKISNSCEATLKRTHEIQSQIHDGKKPKLIKDTAGLSVFQKSESKALGNSTSISYMY